MNDDLISIIIPVYNAEKYIEETIKNLQNQTYNNFELIIIDNKSTDNSLKIIKSFQESKLVLIENEKNEGPAIARNKGLKLSKGRYICFQDADDLWEKDKLEKQFTFMKKLDCAFSYTGYVYMYSNRKKVVSVPETLTYKQAFRDMRILTISVMFDTDKIDKKDLEMPNIQNEDIATWYRLLRKGYISYGLNEPLVIYRKFKNTRSSNKFLNMKNRWYIYRKQEHFNLFISIYYIFLYMISGIRKRI